LVPSSEFGEWLRRFILASRLELSNLPAGIDKKKFSLIDFSPPCQVIALWYGDGAVTQHMLVTKDSRRGDLDIIAVGPLGYDAMTRQMKAILNLPGLQVPLEPDEASHHGVATYAAVLKDQFLTIALAAPYFAQQPKHEGEPAVCDQMAFVYGGFTWRVMGDLTSIEPEKMAKKLFDKVIESIERDQNPEPLPAGAEGEEEHGPRVQERPPPGIG
jgi:hypothetical protein